MNRKVISMSCSRTTRVLPGLSQALSWLHQGLPPADEPRTALLDEITTPAPRGLPNAVGSHHAARKFSRARAALG
jgi:hypothetical protein